VTKQYDNNLPEQQTLPDLTLVDLKKNYRDLKKILF